LFTSCISFRIRVVYDDEKERPSQELWGLTFEKRKISNFFYFKQRQASVHITLPPLGILFYNCP
jgi:hypothetical protein